MITLLSLFAFTFGMLGSRCVSKGTLRPAYWLGAGNGICLIALNGLIALRGDPALALMIVPSAWGLAMSCTGLRRLRKEGM